MASSKVFQAKNEKTRVRIGWLERKAFDCMMSPDVDDLKGLEKPTSG
jgi:hypothetical protein